MLMLAMLEFEGTSSAVSEFLSIQYFTQLTIFLILIFDTNFDTYI